MDAGGDDRRIDRALPTTVVNGAAGAPGGAPGDHHRRSRVIEAHALFLSSLILVGGSIGDQLGRKRMLLAGVTLFTFASIACGLA